MLKKRFSMPCSLLIIALWVLVWILVTTTDTAPRLCGKGMANIRHEFYRFLKAGLTHTKIIHLLVNASAMFWIGYLYEVRIGSVRFLLLGVACAVLTQIIFLSIYRSAEGSIGGSVYNFALCGFGLTMQFLIPDFPKITLGTWSGNWLAIYLIGANIPVLTSMNISTLVIHGIGFGVGMAAAGVCWLLGVRS